jgi:phospholipid/cholesterol/gamma-HCH transport system substrate-binding protein
LKISREIKTAILVIASILLFIWGYSFERQRSVYELQNIFVEYKSVEGLFTCLVEISSIQLMKKQGYC